MVRAALLLALLILFAGCAQAPHPASQSETADPSTASPTPTLTPAKTPSPTPTSATTTPEPAPTDDRTLGVENGYSYNATLGWVNATDGLNETELRAVVSRSMARVEHLRRLEFDFDVPVEVISRGTFREQYTQWNVSPTLRRFDNGKYEALFLVGEDTDSVEAQRRNFQSAVLGFYDSEADRIIIVSNRDNVAISEPVLGHELVHALQYHHFDAGRFDRSTLDRSNAISGLLEGDARNLDQQYSAECRSNWTCVQPQAAFGGGGGGISHFGLYYLTYFPYSDGPLFVDHFHDRGGWAAVNGLYAHPPKSAEQITIPSKYRNDSPANVFVLDRSSDAWSRVRPANRSPYGTVGQAGIAAMFANPTFDGRPGLIVSSNDLLNRDGDRLRGVDPFEYGFDYADGWAGDTLWIHRNRTGELGYVWRIYWDSDGDAREFASGYRDLLKHWGAVPVDNRTDTWRIPENESAFADAFSIRVSEHRVTIVNAPTVDQLAGVHRLPDGR